jgi:hypothetical protein
MKSKHTLYSGFLTVVRYPFCFRDIRLPRRPKKHSVEVSADMDREMRRWIYIAVQLLEHIKVQAQQLLNNLERIECPMTIRKPIEIPGTERPKSKHS